MVARATLANNAITTLALAITSVSDTTMNVTSAAAFPALAGGNYFFATLLDGSNIPEVVKVTGIAGTIYTIVREQDNTLARTFAVGAKVSMNLNAAVLNELIGKDLVGATGVLGIANGGTGSTTAALAQVALGVQSTANKELIVPARITASRTASPAAGYLAFNASTGNFEGHNGTAWGSIGGGATGGGSDDVFYENGQTVTSNYTITAGKNAMSAGPITIADGVTVTIPDGCVWVITG